MLILCLSIGCLGLGPRVHRVPAPGPHQVPRQDPLRVCRRQEEVDPQSQQRALVIFSPIVV